MRPEDLAIPSARAPATWGQELMELSRALGRNLAQHLDADLALSNFAQRGDRRLVARIDLRCVTLSELTRAIGGGERQLKAVRDVFQAIFNGDAGHGGTFVGCGAILAERSALVLSDRRYPIPNCVNNARWRTICVLYRSRVAVTIATSCDSARSKSSLITMKSNSGACSISLRAAASRRAITAGASCPRFFRRASSASIDGGRMKIPIAVRELSFDLPCALPVDFEQDVDTGAHPLLDPDTRCRVVVAVHLGAFDEFAGRAPPLELVDSNEVILAAALLAGARRACRVGNRQLDVRVAREQRIDQTLICPRPTARPP